jgi:hypothetical protein
VPEPSVKRVHVCASSERAPEPPLGPETTWRAQRVAIRKSVGLPTTARAPPERRSAAGSGPDAKRPIWEMSKYFALFDQFTQRLVLIDQEQSLDFPLSGATARARQE